MRWNVATFGAQRLQIGSGMFDVGVSSRKTSNASSARMSAAFAKLGKFQALTASFEQSKHTVLLHVLYLKQSAS